MDSLKIEGFAQDSKPQDSAKEYGIYSRFRKIQQDSTRHSGIQKDLLKVL